MGVTLAVGLGVLVYAACFVHTFRWALREEFPVQDGDEWGDAALALTMGVIIGAFFGLIIAPWHVFLVAVEGKSAAAFVRRLGGESDEQRQRRLRAQERRIAELERELGIG